MSPEVVVGLVGALGVLVGAFVSGRYAYRNMLLTTRTEKSRVELEIRLRDLDSRYKPVFSFLAVANSLVFPAVDANVFLEMFRLLGDVEMWNAIYATGDRELIALCVKLTSKAVEIKAEPEVGEGADFDEIAEINSEVRYGLYTEVLSTVYKLAENREKEREALFKRFRHDFL